MVAVDDEVGVEGHRLVEHVAHVRRFALEIDQLQRGVFVQVAVVVVLGQARRARRFRLHAHRAVFHGVDVPALVFKAEDIGAVDHRVRPFFDGHARGLDGRIVRRALHLLHQDERGRGQVGHRVGGGQVRPELLPLDGHRAHEPVGERAALHERPHAAVAHLELVGRAAGRARRALAVVHGADGRAVERVFRGRVVKVLRERQRALHGVIEVFVPLRVVLRHAQRRRPALVAGVDLVVAAVQLRLRVDLPVGVHGAVDVQVDVRPLAVAVGIGVLPHLVPGDGLFVLKAVDDGSVVRVDVQRAARAVVERAVDRLAVGDGVLGEQLRRRIVRRVGKRQDVPRRVHEHLAHRVAHDRAGQVVLGQGEEVVVLLLLRQVERLQRAAFCRAALVHDRQRVRAHGDGARRIVDGEAVLCAVCKVELEREREAGLVKRRGEPLAPRAAAVEPGLGHGQVHVAEPPVRRRIDIVVGDLLRRGVGHVVGVVLRGELVARGIRVVRRGRACGGVHVRFAHLQLADVDVRGRVEVADADQGRPHVVAQHGLAELLILIIGIFRAAHGHGAVHL